MSTKKPYCKVCYDLGKSEQEYTNHWVKDFNGKTTCPTLLNTECRYCFKLGHTAKYCEVLVKNNKKKERINNSYYQELPKKQPEQKKQANKYAVLIEDSNSEEEEEAQIEEYPVLTSLRAMEVREPNTNCCWAEIAAKPKVQMEEKPVITITTKPVIKKSWADWSDTEDETEDEFADEFEHETW